MRLSTELSALRPALQAAAVAGLQTSLNLAPQLSS